MFVSLSLCSLAGSGIVISSIDNLPAQLPREATDYFGARLKPFIHDFVRNTLAYCLSCAVLHFIFTALLVFSLVLVVEY